MASAENPSDFDPSRFLSSFIDVAKAVLLNPKVFFSAMVRQGTFTHPVTFLVSCVTVHTFLADLIHRSEGLVFQNLVMGITNPFLTAGIFFLILTRLFDSPGTYGATFRINAYASAVGLVTWIPVVGPFLELYRLYILVVGLRTIYEIKTSRAVITIFLTLVVYTVMFRVLYNVTGGQLITLPG
jgi:hypothetical protein